MWLLIKRMIRSQTRRVWRLRVPALLPVLFVGLVMFGAGLSVAMAEHTRNAEVVFDEVYEEINLADIIITAGEGWTYTDAEWQGVCDEMRAQQADDPLAILDCETRYFHQEKAYLSNGSQVPAVFHGFDDMSTTGVSGLYLVDGRMPVAPDEVVLDSHVIDDIEKLNADSTRAEEMPAIELGDTVTLVLNGSIVSRTVVGTAISADHIWFVPDRGQLMPAPGAFMAFYMPAEGLLPAIGESPDTRTVMHVDVAGTPSMDLQDTKDVDEGVELRAVKAKFNVALDEANLTNARVEDRSALWGVELLRQDLEGNRKAQPMYLIFLVGVSSLVIAISLDRLIRRQSREIAVMMAVGTPASQILLSYLTVPLLLGGSGAALGVGFGRIMSEALTRWYFAEFVGIPDVPVPHYDELALTTVLLTMMLVTGAGIFPAIRATRLKPLEVMSARHTRRPSGFMRKLTGGLPTTVSLGIRSTFRRPIRLSATVLGLGMSLVLVGGMMLMMASMTSWFEASIRDVETWDARAEFPPLDDGAVRDWALEHEDQYEMEWALVFPANLSGDDKTFLLTAVESFSEDGVDTMHASRLIEGRLPETGAAIPEAVIDLGVAKFANENGTPIEVGDDILINVGTSNKMRFSVVGIVDEMTRSVWAHHEDVTAPLEEAFGIAPHNVLLLRGDVSNITLEEIPGVTVTVRADTIAMFESSWENQEQMMFAFLGFGWLIAIAVLVNTLMINLTEHDTEFATLRILGASLWRLTGVLVVESLLLGLLGGIVGAAGSAGFAYAMVSAFSTWTWSFPADIQFAGLVQIIGMVILFSVAITPIGVFRLWRMDLVEKAKEYAE